MLRAVMGVSLLLQKRLAASVLKCGKRKVPRARTRPVRRVGTAGRDVRCGRRLPRGGEGAAALWQQGSRVERGTGIRLSRQLA